MGPSILLNSNRELHTGFQFVPKSMTLDDLELPLGLRAMLHNGCIFDVQCVKTKDDACLQYRYCKCSPSSFSQHKLLCRYSKDFLRELSSNRVGWLKSTYLQFCRCFVFVSCRNKANISVHYDNSSSDFLLGPQPLIVIQ